MSIMDEIVSKMKLKHVDAGNSPIYTNRAICVNGVFGWPWQSTTISTCFAYEVPPPFAHILQYGMLMICCDRTIASYTSSMQVRVQQTVSFFFVVKAQTQPKQNALHSDTPTTPLLYPTIKFACKCPSWMKLFRK